MNNVPSGELARALREGHGETSREGERDTDGTSPREADEAVSSFFCFTDAPRD